MTQIYIEKEEEKFRELVEKAFDNDFITEIQKDALIAKYERKLDGEPLTIQDRNALRLLRNTIAHNQDTMTDHAKFSLKLDMIIRLLSYVDNQTGIYCHVCKEGLLIKRTVSSWIQGTNYELILEQKPAQICSNNTCQSTSFSLQVEVQEAEILKEIEKQLRVIRTTTPEELENKKCPQCRSEALEEKNKGEVYKYQQGLYHIKIKEVPLQAYCTLCNYQKIGKNVGKEIMKLEQLLNSKVITLLDYEG
ncbi:MAG TPA: hypothetical protein VMZ29_15470 [Candidatus Bathyarchaeia archaeon]|nr:hypothetical protein [Candidatus Bathyarchaeia archaeon]